MMVMWIALLSALVSFVFGVVVGAAIDARFKPVARRTFRKTICSAPSRRPS